MIESEMPDRAGSPQLDVGSRLGPYSLEAPLGEGGMGVVYRARRDDGTVVALKVLKPELSGDEVYQKRFMHEARAATEVQHTHLVPVVDAGHDNGFHYLAVAYVEGSSLEGVIAEGGPLPFREIARVVADVGAGLDALHRAGLVHRDVKPSNIMIDPSGFAALTDFGLARGRGYTVLTKPGQVMGTLDYIAPELIQGAHASAATDIYALGCTVFEAVAGTPPFAHKSVFEAAIAHLEEEPPNPCVTRPDAPGSLGWAIVQALAKDPQRRPPTATAYAHMIGASMRSDPA
jgi:serine/threonine protein kinase